MLRNRRNCCAAEEKHFQQFEMIEFDEKQPRFLTIIFFSRGATASLGSFLDTFQKIADAASNTKGKIIFVFSLSW